MAEPPPPIPQWTPNQRELDDIDLLISGAFEPPIDGFVDPATAGEAAPITLVTSGYAAEMARALGKLDLIDPEGAPVARLSIRGSYDAGGGLVGLAGPVEPLAHNEFGPFRRLRLTPRQVHEANPRDTLLAVPVTRALTQADLDRIDEAAGRARLTPLLLACVGSGMPQDISAPALVRATLAGAGLLGREVHVVVVSAAHHDTGAEGPSGRSANAWLLDSVARAYGGTSLVLSGEPSGARPSAIEAIAVKDRPPRDRRGAVIFFTGLSGSGKSTLARALIDHILERGERSVTSLDGDVVRHHLSKGLGFSREDRETNILRIGFVAAEVSRHGGLAVCSPIAPFESTRAEVRRMVEQAGGGFVLIHVATPLEECERRDRKGLYAKARAGQIPDFTGISSPYQEPAHAIKIDTTNRDIAQCLDELIDALASEGWLRH